MLLPISCKPQVQPSGVLLLLYDTHRSLHRSCWSSLWTQDKAQALISEPWPLMLPALVSQVEQPFNTERQSPAESPSFKEALLSCLCAGSLEDELKVLQNQKASRRQIMAARVRLAEKRILQGTLDAVRK